MTGPELRAVVLTALTPQNVAEVAAITDALDLFTSYCARFSVRDSRFSLLDQTVIDRRAWEAATAIRKRLTEAYGKFYAGAEGRKIMADAFDASNPPSFDISDTPAPSSASATQPSDVSDTSSDDPPKGAA